MDKETRNERLAQSDFFVTCGKCQEPTSIGEKSLTVQMWMENPRLGQIVNFNCERCNTPQSFNTATQQITLR